MREVVKSIELHKTVWETFWALWGTFDKKQSDLQEYEKCNKNVGPKCSFAIQNVPRTQSAVYVGFLKSAFLKSGLSLVYMSWQQ